MVWFKVSQVWTLKFPHTVGYKPFYKIFMNTKFLVCSYERFTHTPIRIQLNKPGLPLVWQKREEVIHTRTLLSIERVDNYLPSPCACSEKSCRMPNPCPTAFWEVSVPWESEASSTTATTEARHRDVWKYTTYREQDRKRFMLLLA